ncbi:hypothetical protein HS7_01590 [Sulfolobales archaeon HS-7]|nr:hypothetical protein HS7_01590 [Sulfolobales archaeon HS-7]
MENTQGTVIKNLVLVVSSIDAFLMGLLYAAGLYTLLYDKFPITQTWMATVLSTHISLAMLVGFATAFLFVATYMSNVKSLFYLGLASILSVAVAAAGGLLFYAGYNPDFAYLMAFGFLGAFISSTGCIFYSI